MNKSNIISSVVIIAVVAFFGLYDFNKKESSSFGSVESGNESQSTTTVGMGNGLHRLIKGDAENVIGDTPCVFNNVVIASTSATAFTLWNAASTTDSGSTTIATFKASVVEGTYALDAVAPRGCAVSLPTGFNGSAIIMYK